MRARLPPPGSRRLGPRPQRAVRPNGAARPPHSAPPDSRPPPPLRESSQTPPNPPRHPRGSLRLHPLPQQPAQPAQQQPPRGGGRDAAPARSRRIRRAVTLRPKRPAACACAPSRGRRARSPRSPAVGRRRRAVHSPGAVRASRNRPRGVREKSGRAGLRLAPRRRSGGSPALSPPPPALRAAQSADEGSQALPTRPWTLRAPTRPATPRPGCSRAPRHCSWAGAPSCRTPLQRGG
mmetsp:Transcript_576/g.1560  ORF Transcript_576/g.1560 Transcript_576/m.1560 type:complete len:236 (+) Transcript_576:922-1629(+)